MRIGKAIIPATLLTGLALSSAAYAWNSDGKGNIRCGDGSHATAMQDADGKWTVTQAGTKGKLGGSFAIEGQAALYGCGE